MKQNNLVAMAVEGMQNSYCMKVSADDIEIVKVMPNTFIFIRKNTHYVNSTEPLRYVCNHNGYKAYADLIF